MSIDTEGGGRGNSTFTAQEEEEMQALARDPRIYEKMAQSIAPSISGEYTVDIKKAIACLLMGGSRKVSCMQYGSTCTIAHCYHHHVLTRFSPMACVCEETSTSC